MSLRSAPLGLLLTAFSPVALSASGSCEAGQECSAEDTSLLQSRLSWSNSPPSNPWWFPQPQVKTAKDEWHEVAKKIAAGVPKGQSGTLQSGAPHPQCTRSGVAFEGGGFVALADYIGVVTGLMHELPYIACNYREWNIGTIFKRFGSISGISGGTWFASQLIYSDTFDEMIYASSLHPESTEAIFKKYYGKVLNVFTNTSIAGTLQGLAACLYKLLPMVTLQEAARTGTPLSMLQSGVNGEQLPTDSKYLQWYIEMIGEAIILIQAGGVTWEDLVVNLFQRGAEIAPDWTLGGSAPRSWAHGKHYLIGSTAVTPSGDENAPLAQLNITGRSSTGTVLSYTVDRPKAGSPPTFTPVKFAVEVGGGAHQNSLQPFCFTEGGCGEDVINYKYHGKISKRKLADLFKTGFETQAGLLPISATAAASSAFEGRTAVELGLGSQQGCVELAVWASPGVGHGQAFSAARKLRDSLASPFPVTPEQAKWTVEEGLQPLLDGGVTDGTGIGNLAATADDIVAFLNIGDGTMELESFLDVFESAQYPAKVLFSSPSRLEVQEAFASGSTFSTMETPTKMRFLQNIVYGTLNCRTAEVPSFGIPAGRAIKLSFIAVNTSNITLGLIESNFSYNSFYNFATVSAEIVNTMTSMVNAPKTRHMLKSFFL